jgi:hypothetical protein
VTTERDANGQYLAAYRQEGAGRYTKMKARYLDTIQPPGGAPRAFAGPMSGPPRTFMRVERSEHELRADGGGRLLEVRGSEVLVLQIGGPGVALKTTVALELGGGRLADASTLVGAFTRQRAGLVAQPMEQMALDARAERARRDRVLLAGAGLPELLGAWAALPSDPPPSSREAGDLTARFEALFRTDAAAAAQVPALVRHFSVERGKLLVDALSLAATPATARALAQVSTDVAAPPRARGQAIQYLALQPEPAEEVVVAVASLLDDGDVRLRQLARSTYGACARSLRSSDPVRARRIVDDLQARLGRAGAGEQRDFLNALGNAGDPASLPLLRRLIEQAERHLRPEAVAALRGIDHPEVDPLLVDLLRAPEPAVRLAAIRAIRARAIGPFAAALVEVARQDASEVVRNGATTLLRDRASQLPTLRPVVQALAGRGVSAETRPPELPPR